MEKVGDKAVAVRRASFQLLVLLAGLLALLLWGAEAASAQDLPIDTEEPELSTPSGSSPTEAVSTTRGAVADTSDQVTGTLPQSSPQASLSTEPEVEGDVPPAPGAGVPVIGSTPPVLSGAGGTAGEAAETAASVAIEGTAAAAGVKEAARAALRTTAQAATTVHSSQDLIVKAVEPAPTLVDEALTRTALDPVLEATDRTTKLIGNLREVEPLQVATPARAGDKADGWTGLADKSSSFPSETGKGWAVESDRQAGARDSVGPQSLSAVRDTSGTAWTAGPAVGPGGSGATTPVVPNPFDSRFPIPGSLSPGEGGGVHILLLAAFIALLGLAAPGTSRWLRLGPALGGPQGYFSLAERPG